MKTTHQPLAIKKFYFGIGGMPGASHSIEYKAGVFAYRTYPEDMALPRETDPLLIALGIERDEPLIHQDSMNEDLTISAEKIDRFYHYIKRYCKGWKKEYFMDEVIDGTRWECDIWIGDFRLRSDGHQAFPSNFDTLQDKLSILTDGKIFT